MTLPQQEIIFTREREVVDGWVQVVHPAITNLLSNTPRQTLREIRPSCKGLLVRVGNNVHNNGVFVIRPLTFADTRLQVANPALVAFFGAASEKKDIKSVQN